MTNDDKKALTSEDLTQEEKLEKLEALCEEIGLDVEELDQSDLEDMGVKGELTIKVYNEDGEVKEEIYETL